MDSEAMLTIRAAGAAVVLLVSTTSLAQQVQPRARWWDSPAMQASLHLTRDQVTKIDAIFDSTLPQRQALRKQLDALEEQEDSALSHATLDDAAAMLLIERVEAVRAQRNTARALMLYQIRRVLTPEQRQWFNRRITAAAGGTNQR